ncbi:hypothetical protein KGY14_15600 [Ameyamaea chiangmaiensis]|uniref:Uncharacterized protein n=1 Tax=Ameyamaea chiangmaiensis TaxID=442969 RepID=A0A850PD71_9PROT|nr:hypothetical protein [Ameyamaea chiangmaiensis]MBS4076613.1 hypothetical protein [Ameyamaea chiangmaiensis]NVN39892.1 hypothetical protein [Ameyamaea chiangmaiensis]
MQQTIAADIVLYLQRLDRPVLSKGEQISRFVDFLSETHKIVGCRREECRKRLRRFGHVLGASCPMTGMARDVERLITAMEDIGTRPLTPARLQSALRISSRERIQWTREGKLRPIATRVIKDRGHFSLALYSADDVARLLMSPEILASWRT